MERKLRKGGVRMGIKIFIDNENESSYKKKYKGKNPKYRRGKYNKKKKKDVSMGMSKMMRAIRGE